MAIGPSVNTSLGSQEFPFCMTASSVIYTMATLAPYVGGGQGYQYGQLLAQYNSTVAIAGVTQGQFVNYDSTYGLGGNGQGIFVGVLVDDLFQSNSPAATTTILGQVQIAIMLLNGAYIQSLLVGTNTSVDVPAAIAQRKAKVVMDYFNGFPVNPNGVPTGTPPGATATFTNLIYGL